MKKIIIGTVIFLAAPLVSYASINSNLSYGSTGEQVTELQQFLISNGYLQGSATGNFYSLTQQAVENFQSANSISPTGYVGSLTRTAINADLTGQVNTPKNTTNAILPSTNSVQPQNNYSANILATKLSPELAFFTCNYYNRYGNVLFSESGNGLLGQYTGGNYFINTVLGAVTNTSYAGYQILPGSCTVSFPAGASLYGGGLSTFTVGSDIGQSQIINLVSNAGIDFAQIMIDTSNNYLATHALTTNLQNYCSTRGSVGDSVVVVGWPPNSTSLMLTGNITSASGYYDSTNIAIPNGMQGSTAVSLTNGCILGQINSAGEIADQYQLSYMFGN